MDPPPTFARDDVSDVGQPNRVRCRGDDRLLQPVRCDRQVVTAFACARFESATDEHPEASPPHEAPDPAAACRPAFYAKCGMHVRATMTAVMLDTDASKRDRTAAYRVLGGLGLVST